MSINPRNILLAASLALYLLPLIIFEYEPEFYAYMVLVFIAASIGTFAGTRRSHEKPQIRKTAAVQLLAAVFAIGHIAGSLSVSFASTDYSADHVSESVGAQGTGAMLGTLVSFLNIACLAVLAAGRRRTLFLTVVGMNILEGVLFGAYRSPIIFLALASLFHFRAHLTVVQGIALGIGGLAALTALNFKRQGLEVQTLIDLGTFARGVFVVNNFHDLWSSGVDFNATRLLERLPLVFIPSALYPEKGIISFSHLMTEAVYGYIPTITLKPIITFGLFAEAWIYLGYWGFVLVGLCTYLYARLVADCFRVSRFLGIYFALKYVMIFRSSLDAFIFNYASTYLLLWAFLLGLKCLNFETSSRLRQSSAVNAQTA